MRRRRLIVHSLRKGCGDLFPRLDAGIEPHLLAFDGTPKPPPVWDQPSSSANVPNHNRIGRLEHDGRGLWLSAGYGHPESFWGSDKHFVFVRPVTNPALTHIALTQGFLYLD
jgi:hypothetical protein